jgi:hypothetical protein
MCIEYKNCVWFADLRWNVESTEKPEKTGK